MKDLLLAERAQDDFDSLCATCHGPSGHGDGTVADFNGLVAADLTTLASRNGGAFPLERVERVIDGRDEVKLHGPRDMPVWGEHFLYDIDQPGLSRQQRDAQVRERIGALAAFLARLQGK